VKSLTISAISFCLLLLGCDSQRIFDQYTEVEGKWHQDSTLSYSFNLPDASIHYNMFLNITYDRTYPYYNLYVSFRLLDESDSILQERLEELIFFDPKTGYPQGNGSGEQYELQRPLAEQFMFPDKGIYKVEFSQFMRVEELPAIRRIGFRLEKFEEN
jgi:gliding motility-associated lipoprotein GldH